MEGPIIAFALIAALAIPVVAIVGGIAAGIVKTLSRRKLLEMAQRERIAAIERGIDPDKLPPLQLPEGWTNGRTKPTFEQQQLKRSHLLRVWGYILTAFGATLFIALLVTGEDEGGWISGLVFMGIGVGLLLGSRVGRPTPEEVRESLERQKGAHALQ
jgi:hypothetical protein